MSAFATMKRQPLVPMEPETAELTARLCYAMMRVQWVTMGAGPLPPWEECAFQSHVREAVSLILTRLQRGEAPAAIMLRSPDLLTSESWEAVVQVMVGRGPYGAQQGLG